LTEQSEKFKPFNDGTNSNDYINSNTQYENDLLKQKFCLKDLHDSKFKILTKRSYSENDIIEEDHQVLK
jgi:hypothetical protein